MICPNCYKMVPFHSIRHVWWLLRGGWMPAEPGDLSDDGFDFYPRKGD